MAYAFDQGRGGTGSGVSYALSFLSTPPVGSLIVVAVSSYGANLTTTAVADNQGNTYTRRVVLNDFEVGSDVAIYEGVAATSSGTFTITVTPADGGDITLGISAFTGNATTNPQDQTNSHYQTPTQLTLSSGDVTPTEANELLVAACAHVESDRTITEDGDWSLIYENEGGAINMPLSFIYKIQTSIVTEDADWTFGAITTGAGVIASYKAAPAAPSGKELTLIGVG